MTDTSRRAFWGVTAFYLAVTVALAAPFSLHPGTRLLTNDSDAMLVRWILAWDVHAFTAQPWAIFDANTFAPLPNTLAFAENLIGGALFAAPVLWLTGNLVLAMNLVSLLSIPLSGLGTFLLARRVGVSVAGAVLAGLIYAFTPPRFLRIEQFQLTTIHWIPFCLAFVHEYLDTGRPRALRLALACFSLQALSGGHGAAFLATGVIALLVWRFGLGEPVALVRRVKDMGVVGGLALVPTILVFLPYRSAQHDMGLARTLDGWGTAPASFLATSSYIDNWLLTLLPAWTRDHADAYLFPGWIPLAVVAAGLFAVLVWPARGEADGAPSPGWGRLAGAVTTLALLVGALGAWGLATDSTRLKVGDVTIATMRDPWRIWWYFAGFVALRWWLARRVPVTPLATARRWLRALPRLRTNHAVFYAALTLFCTWLLVGPPYGVWQWVYEWPVLSFIRVPTRFLLLGLIGLGVLAGMAFDRLAGRLAPAPRATVAAVLAALCLAEFTSPSLEGRPAEVTIPAIDHYVASLPGRFTIAEVPMPDPDDTGWQNTRNATYMLHSTAHWQKTVNGYSGLLPARHAELFAALRDFPNRNAVALLRDFGVTYVVDHNDWADAPTRAEVQKRYDAFTGELELVKEIGSDRLYKVK